MSSNKDVILFFICFFIVIGVGFIIGRLSVECGVEHVNNTVVKEIPTLIYKDRIINQTNEVDCIEKAKEEIQKYQKDSKELKELFNE